MVYGPTITNAGWNVTRKALLSCTGAERKMTVEGSSGPAGLRPLCLFLVFLGHNVLLTRGQLPVFSPCPTVLSQPEDTTTGTSLFSISATGHSGQFPAVNLSLSIPDLNTESLVNLTGARHVGNNLWTSDVILAAELDRDYEPSTRYLWFRAQDTNNNPSETRCTLIILDVNDNPPSFQGQPFVIRVSENTTIGSVLGPQIRATDPDVTDGNIVLLPQFPDSSVEAVFDTNMVAEQIGEAAMNITLAQPLDYEKRIFYTFDVMAVDGGGLNSTAVVTVTVTDVQDTPPFFLLDSYRAAIVENEAAGTSIIKVSAEDGDRDPPNRIMYSIVSGRTDFFSIDNITGDITSLVVLDRDNVTMVGEDGVFQLTVRATETDDVQPQYGNMTSDVMVVVVVEDVNDHPPTFGSNAPYTAFVREDAPLDSLIYFDGDGYISVFDADQGRNSHFSLTVERDGVPWPALEATPSDIYSEALVLLRVKDAGVFKDAAGTHIALQLVAREVSTPEGHSSTAEVVITVERLPEPAPTPAPVVNEGITAPDVIVFIIGFLVIFNMVASVLIIWFMRKRSKPPRQGLVRKGSKYYVNGVETNPQGQGIQNGSAVTLRPDSILVEVEGKDRCDVVPLSAIMSGKGRSSSAAAAGAGAAGGGGSKLSVSYDTIVDDANQTDRKVLLANGVPPAKSDSGSEIVTKAHVNSVESASSSSSSSSSQVTATATVSGDSSSTAVPSFSMAKRNVSSPRNPALSFLNPTSTATSAQDASSFQMATTAFPSSASAAAAATTITTTTTADASIASTSSPGTTASSAPAQPVTRFSAKGVVSTTIAAVPGYAVASSVGLPGGATVSVPAAGSGRDGAAHALGVIEEAESAPEILY